MYFEYYCWSDIRDAIDFDDWSLYFFDWNRLVPGVKNYIDAEKQKVGKITKCRFNFSLIRSFADLFHIQFYTIIYEYSCSLFGSEMKRREIVVLQ